MDPFLPLDRVTADDLPRAGGKAANCARLKRAGFPVPDGIVVAADATDAQIATLARHPWFDLQPPDVRLAVRSSGLGEDSAGHSFAGMHETELNVPRDRVVAAVVACRRSAQSAQARAYRAARGLGDEDVRIGVLVQRMVPAVTSGVAFTINPITGADEIVVNSVAGLGEVLVSGRVEPEQAILPKGDASALAQLLVRIERHFGAPQDVEWCHDGTSYWIVQSRPVTTARPDVEWTRANLAEVLPDQLSPQALDVFVPLLNVGERKFFGRLMAPESELGPIVKPFHGRLYFNLSQLRHVVGLIGAAFADTLRSLGHPERIHPDDEVVKRPPLGEFLQALPDLARIVWRTLFARRTFERHAVKTAETIARLTAVDPRTLPDTAIWDTFQWWLDLIPHTMTAVFVMSSVQGLEDILRRACCAAGFPYDRLVYPQLAAGERSVSSEQAFALDTLAAAARGDATAAEYLRRNDGTFRDYRSALAGTGFLRRLDEFLGAYGHRGRYESDWSIPRLHEDPAPVLFAVREQLTASPQDPEAIVRRQAEEAAAAMREFEARLTAWQRWTLLPRVRVLLARLKRQYVWRERVRSDLTRVISHLRAWHLVLAERFVERGWLDRRDDYFLLRLDEVRQAAQDPGRGGTLRAIAEARAAQLAAERDLPMPLFMRESELASLIAAAVRPKADTRIDRIHSVERGVRLQSDLTGLCVSPGSVEAEVVVMRDPNEFASMKRGAILVTTATDPSWTPLFTLASGVIVEVGGMLSHASTIAREYGLPALANVKDATRVLKTGDRVRLDASGGIVRRLVA